MKCLDCPLCVSDYCDSCGDGDIYCLITRDYAKDDGGCTRTNKFILSQDKQKLKDKLLEEECRFWSAVAAEYEKENSWFFSFG